jgi:hypothetical protein
MGGDGCDAVAGDADVEFAERGTGTIGDLGVEDEDASWRGVLRLGVRAGGENQRREECQGQN